MDKPPPIAGWLWVKEGFALFRKQPAEISSLFLAYMFLMMTLGFLPLVGQVLPLVLIPVFSMAFMQACVQIEQGKKVYPNLLLAGFRSPAVKRLLKLGVLYFIAAAIAVAASAIVDGGVFWDIMSGRKDLDTDAIRSSGLSLSMMFSAAVYTPAAMAFWYAAPLIAWQDMSVGKAIFYSFFAVKRSGMAFLVYGLCWALIGIILPAVLSSIVALVVGKAFAVMIVLLTISLVLTVIMYCSFYPTYTHIFGRPEQRAVPQLPQP
ncbi:BPSS1780 family membrane protein [Noviherbaspirillum denitrificans]|uniref:Transmembrane protein n=1 Tax=Noviherbaspirillum denitrificans TaxID=1968433 RepID=A0A254TLE3_9BURK|nr:BPSS1780 family membrane protein [Noviherbaspirillum denitrificans]OWW20538.1 hypothetical protein AYR66_14615 [Noviherbaspirillum denitrificans]